MSKFEVRDNSGSLFRNADKGDNERAPDYKGDGMVNGQPVWVSGWLKVAQSGKKYMSLAFEPKQAQKPVRARDDAARARQLDDSPPF